MPRTEAEKKRQKKYRNAHRDKINKRRRTLREMRKMLKTLRNENSQLQKPLLNTAMNITPLIELGNGKT